MEKIEPEPIADVEKLPAEQLSNEVPVLDLAPPTNATTEPMTEPLTVPMTEPQAEPPLPTAAPMTEPQAEPPLPTAVPMTEPITDPPLPTAVPMTEPQAEPPLPTAEPPAEPMTEPPAEPLSNDLYSTGTTEISQPSGEEIQSIGYDDDNDDEEEDGPEIQSEVTHNLTFLLIIKEVPGKNIAEQYVYELTNKLSLLKIPHVFKILEGRKNRKMVGGTSESTFPFNLFENAANQVAKDKQVLSKERESIVGNMFSFIKTSSSKEIEFEKEVEEYDEPDEPERELEFREGVDIRKIELKIYSRERCEKRVLGLSELEEYIKEKE